MIKKILKVVGSNVIYLLSLNFLGIVLFVFLGFIIGEVILSGILSNYISLGKITGFLFFLISLIVVLAKEQEIVYKKEIDSKYLSVLTNFIVTFCVFVSLYKFGIILNLILTTISLSLFILFKKYLTEDLSVAEN